MDNPQVDYLDQEMLLMGTRIQELEVQNSKLREVIIVAKLALMQPLDGWKGEHEAKAIKLINKVLK
jgi:hypothetical protein